MDDLKDVRSLSLSLAFSTEGPWLPFAFMADFLTIEALIFSIWKDGMIIFLEVYCSIDISALICVVRMFLA